MYFLQAIVNIEEVRHFFKGQGGYGRFTVEQCLASITPPSTDSFMDEFGDVSIPIVNRGACIYANDRPRHINVQRAYGLVNEWLEEVVKPLAGHWTQVRRTWRIQIAPDILLEDECYGVTQVTPNTIDITLDTKPHKGYSELLSTLLHEVGHALTVQEAPEHESNMIKGITSGGPHLVKPTGSKYTIWLC